MKTQHFGRCEETYLLNAPLLFLKRFCLRFSLKDEPSTHRKKMTYGILVKCYNSDGKPCKAEILCGGEYKGFTDPDTGELVAETQYEGAYDVTAIRYGKRETKSARTGGTVTFMGM
jgi:hypothetical protein